MNNDKRQVREIIKEEGVVLYLDIIPDSIFSFRNKQIIRDYADGLLLREISEKHGVSQGRLNYIAREFCRKALNNKRGRSYLEIASDREFSQTERAILKDHLDYMENREICFKYNIKIGYLQELLMRLWNARMKYSSDDKGKE